MPSHLWAAFPVPDDTVQVVGDVGIQASGQVPRFAYPVIIFSSGRERERAIPVSIHLIHLAENPEKNTLYSCGQQCKN